MGKNKVRLKGGKGARWAKGQSSNSNPEKNRHRIAAKSRFHQYGNSESSNQGPNKLTAAALLRHDAVLGDSGDASMEDKGEDSLSFKMTNKTFDTFASDWTQTTNVAFDKLLKKFQLQNNGHKEMLAVLAAVTEVIKQQGGTETESEYFAALMTTLEVSNSEENLAAVVRLLSLVIKKVPEDILVSRFSQVCELLLDTLARNAESQNVALIRGLLGCISVVLRVQPASVWSLSETGKVFQSILTYTTHTKPKIRKAGLHAVVSVVRGGEAGPSGVHPSAALASQHCLAVITSSGPSDNSILYMLSLLRSLLPALPRQQTKSCCETILKLLTLGSQVMVSTGFAALHGLFSSRPGLSTLTTDLNAQLITALYDYKPSNNDAGPVIAWLAVMQEGLLNLTQHDPTLCHSHINRFCQAAAACWLSERADVVKSAGLALRAVLSECMKGAKKDICTKVVETLGDGIKYQYHSAWQVVLGVMAVMAEVVGSEQPDTLPAFLASLAELRGSHNFSLEGEVDSVFGKAVASMGPRRVLAAVPLNITGNETDYEFRSSWLLPVLRDSIKNTELAYFTTYFLPLAARCLNRSIDCGTKEDKIGQKSYEVITYQIWSLLPGFCISPTDLADSFKGLAKILGTQLGTRKEIRLDILTGLRNLISRNLDHPENRAELARFAKNFLPILFNLYTTKPIGAEEAGQRMSSLETIKIYFKITDSDLVGSMFDKALEKFTAQGVDQFTKDAVLDLLRCLLPHVDEPRIRNLYNEAKKRITSLDHKEQKKAYRALEEVCRCSTRAGQAFLATSLPDIQALLLTSLSRIAASSQAPRLRCLISVLGQLQEPNMEFARAVIPEAILCIKAVNNKARESAFTLLIAVGESMQRWKGDRENDDVIRDYMQSMLAGLAGNPTLIHCTILAVSRIYFQFRDIFPQDLTEQLLSNILMLLSSSSREVSGAALSFIKVFVTTTSPLTAAKFVPQIVKSLANMPEDCKRHFRLKSKYLFERLSRKFGHDLVASLVPKSDEKTHKRLKNIRKEIARRSRRVSEDGSGQEEVDADFGVSRGRQKTMEELLADSSDDDEDLYEDGGGGGGSGKEKKGRRKKAAAATGTWIQEGGEGIVDLLSADAAQSISSTHPKTPKSVVQKEKRKKDEFKIGSDGRMIITEADSDEEENGGGKSRRGARELSDSEDETFDSLVASKKRRVGTSEAASVKSAATAMSGISGASAFSKYKPGGSGIHRKLDTPGAEYKNKKGMGDVKRKGRPDPYAYIPLSHNSLNKRKQAKMKGQFSNVITAAKKGANKGNKKRVQEVKKMIKDMKVS